MDSEPDYVLRVKETEICKQCKRIVVGNLNSTNYLINFGVDG